MRIINHIHPFLRANSQQNPTNHPQFFANISAVINTIPLPLTWHKHNCMRNSAAAILNQINLAAHDTGPPLSALPRLPRHVARAIQHFDRATLEPIQTKNKIERDFQDTLTLLDKTLLSSNRPSVADSQISLDRQNAVMLDLQDYLGKPNFSTVLNNTQKLECFAALMSLKNGLANCHFKAEIAAGILTRKGYAVEMVSFGSDKALNVKLIGQAQSQTLIPDHVFLLINRDQSTDLQDANHWNKDAFIFDAWSNISLPGYHLSNYSAKIPSVSGGITHLKPTGGILQNYMDKFSDVLTPEHQLILRNILTSSPP